VIARRVLLLLPHPDDEVVGCAAAIGRLRARGVRFFALYLTTGVPAPEGDWPWRRPHHTTRVERRREEAQRAAVALGIEPVTFCSWPARQLRAHLHEARILTRALIAEHAADCLWVPAYEGGHQDHDAASFLGSTLAHERLVVEFAEYNAWPGARAQAFPVPAGTENTIVLSPAEVAHKRKLLEIYRSERGNLRHVRCRREALRLQLPYDYGRPAHAGRLFYQRFQWVPFRHPRIDFTSPAEVCASFAGFGAADDDDEEAWRAHG
jgi:LmbE family N-acetylglucosaminyl deacetylase